MTEEYHFTLFEEFNKVRESAIATTEPGSRNQYQQRGKTSTTASSRANTSTDQPDTSIEKEVKKPDQCLHQKILLDNSHKICEQCGMLMNKDLTFDPEWRYYGPHDTKHHSDPNRCFVRRMQEITIYKDVERLGFSEKVIIQANQIYEEVTQKKIYRGNSRRGIIFACIFHAYKMNRCAQSHESLIKVFHIEKKVALKGLKFVNLNASKESVFRNNYISPEDLISEIMDKFEATPKQKEEVLQLYKSIENKSSLLNRSRPSSISAALVRYYILTKHKNISMNVFKSKVNLSELTINRIVKEIQRILEPTVSEDHESATVHESN